MMKHWISALGATVLSCSSIAQEIEKQPWEASVELGFISTSGNTETLSVQSKADVLHETEDWQNEYVASVLFKDDEVVAADGTRETQRTAERYFVSAQAAYKLAAEHTNIFAFGSHTLDEFGAYENYTTLALGYGSRWLDRPDMQLDLEIGPGYFRGERVTAENEVQVESGFMVRGAANYRWAVTDSADFKQTVSVEGASDNSRIISETSFSTTVSDDLQLKVGYSIFHNTDVAPEKEKTDTTTFVNLVYKL